MTEKGLVAELAPLHVQSTWSLGRKWFKVQNKQHVVIISKKKRLKIYKKYK